MAKEIITFASDLEIIISATKLFTQASERTLSYSQVIVAFDTFHKIYEPMLKNYHEVTAIKDILETFDKKLKDNYPDEW
ncbi:MAG: hypothetical protein KJ949_00885 [Nanoarchaeota archaeon]|nr:hypothetical protein [Nanoarchaeota archaeon]